MENKALKVAMVGLGFFALLCGGAAVAPFALLHWNDTWGRWDEVPEELAAYEALSSTPTASELEDPVVRGMLRSLRREAPSELFTPAEWAEGDLAVWLTHPHELAARPERIELLGSVVLEGVGEHDTYYVFSFHGPPGHWAGEGAMVGISGPWTDDAVLDPGNPWSELEPGDISTGGQMAMRLHAESYGEQATGWAASP